VHLLHIEGLVAWLPFEITRGSRALMVLAGLGLIYMGRGLARRKRLAWTMALALAACSVLLHLGHHGSILRSLLAAGFGFELWRQRHRFQARTDPRRLRHALFAIPVLAGAISVYGLAGLHELTAPPANVIAGLWSVWRVAAFQDRALADLGGAASFVWSLRLFSVVAAGYVFSAALAPVSLRTFGPSMDSARVAQLAWTHGLDALSYFAKQDDKHHFAIDGRAFLAFRLTNRVAVVAGDPIGEPEAIPPLIEAFVSFCRTNDWVPVFYETSDRYLAQYRAAGLRWFTIGQEATLRLPEWSLAGGAVAKVRQFVNKVRREAPDLEVREYRPTERDPELDDQLEQVSADWLGSKSGGEMGFNLGVFSVEDLADKRTFVARRADGCVEAFVTWLPYAAGRAVVIDAMRHRRQAQAGIMDLLIAESALRFKTEGLETLSLAVAPLAPVDGHGPATPYDRGTRLVFEHLSSVYGFRTLFQFKKKFNPVWQERYLVFPRPDLLARIAYALVRVHYGRV
jgi:phosphatidylglycerol lysyltransferase